MNIQMENKLTNEEKAKVFAMYYPLRAVNTYQYPASSYANMAAIVRIFEGETDIVLPLTPLGKISDEHAITVAKIMGISDVREDVAPFIKKGVIETIKKSSGGYKIYLFLISEGYAVPLFFGLNHWANGKTAIELGIAIENKTL